MRRIVFTIRATLDEERDPEKLREEIEEKAKALSGDEDLDVEYTFSELVR
jgi:acetylornithine deacetylase/succinyl-diaminopimelate desuccinylase-like protein